MASTLFKHVRHDATPRGLSVTSFSSCVHVPVLAYHRVLPHRALNAVTLLEFEQHLRWFHSHGFKTLASAEFERAMMGDCRSERAVVITFDDGYIDNWYLVAPLLRKYQMTALLFVITNKLSERKTRSLGAWSEEGDERYLSWEEISWMTATGVFEVHSHSASHSRFWDERRSRDETMHAMYDDIAESARALRSHGYHHDLHLAWPWGYFKSDWPDEVRKLGFRVCHTMRPGTNFVGSDVRTVRRLDPRNTAALIRMPAAIACSRSFGALLNRASDAWRYMRGRR